MKAVRFSFIIVISVLLFSCEKDMAAEPMCATIVSYSEKIEPLIEMNCATSGCHDQTGQQGGVNLTSYEDVRDNADKILSVIQLDQGNSGFMPLGGQKLADSSIRHFNCWSNNGKLNN